MSDGNLLGSLAAALAKAQAAMDLQTLKGTQAADAAAAAGRVLADLVQGGEDHAFPVAFAMAARACFNGAVSSPVSVPASFVFAHT